VLLEAGAIRFKPILLTALAAMIGAVVILTDPIFQGLAISLLFGLASSTLLTVLVIPAIYRRADHAVSRKADGIEPQQDDVARPDQMGGKVSQHRRRRRHGEVPRLFHPEHRRRAKDQVPERPAANTGQDAEKNEPDNIQLLARSRERPGGGKHGDAAVIEELEKGHAKRMARSCVRFNWVGFARLFRIRIETRSVSKTPFESFQTKTKKGRQKAALLSIHEFQLIIRSAALKNFRAIATIWPSVGWSAGSTPMIRSANR
jgi:hypothetical protein